MPSRTDRTAPANRMGRTAHTHRLPRRRTVGVLALTVLPWVAGPLATWPATAAAPATASSATAGAPTSAPTAPPTATLTAIPAATSVAEPAPGALTAAQVDAAVHRLRADPALSGTDTVRRLRLRDQDRPETTPTPRAEWLRALAEWLSDAGRVLVWLVGALVVAVVAVAARRWARERAEAVALPAASAAPLAVGGHDIRPESLPEAIGPAVMALWLGGSARAALSLLYRGALSRLVHRHGVPIVAASTEGDVQRLARAHLPAEPAAYVDQLIGCWQRAVYGAALPDSAEVQALCDDFEGRLGQARGPGSARPPAAPPATPSPGAPAGAPATGGRS